VSLEHDSKVTQLQLVCNASALQVSVVQAMNAQEFKWITQIRGTPLPNQPDMFYFRCVLPSREIKKERGRRGVGMLVDAGRLPARRDPTTLFFRLSSVKNRLFPNQSAAMS